MTVKRGLFVFLVFGIWIFSSVSFVLAQHPGQGFSTSDFIKVYVEKSEKGSYDNPVYGSPKEFNELRSNCLDYCYTNYKVLEESSQAEKDQKWQDQNTCEVICYSRADKGESLPNLGLCEYVKDKVIKKDVDFFKPFIEGQKQFEWYTLENSKDYPITPGQVYTQSIKIKNDYSIIPKDYFDGYLSLYPDNQIPTYTGTGATRIVADAANEDIDKKIEKCESYLEGLENDVRFVEGSASSFADESKGGKTDTTTYVPRGGDSAYIERYEGEVAIKDINGTVKPLTGKIALVGEGITLITKGTGKVLLIFNDGSKIEIGPNSQFYVGDSEKESIFDFGKLKAKFKCLAGIVKCYTVRTTLASTSVRGTEYVAIADTNATTILVNEGTVSLTETKTGTTQDVPAGNSGIVDVSGIKINSLSDAEWKNATAEFDLEKSNNSWMVYFGVLVVLIAAGFVIYKKMNSSKQSFRKPEKISGGNRKWGIASFVLAIFSILFLLLPFVGIIFAILAVVFAIIQKKQSPTMFATSGLIIGIIGIILNAVLLIAVIPLIAGD